MTDTTEQVDEFFERYLAALLARDAAAVARLYAVPGLILFPDTSIPVTDRSQTEQFFASAWQQYEGIDAASREIVIMGKAPHSVWADVTGATAARQANGSAISSWPHRPATRSAFLRRWSSFPNRLELARANRNALLSSTKHGDPGRLGGIPELH
jgi:hypothetical protein